MKTLTGLFQTRARQTPAQMAYRQFDASAGRWVGYSWSDMWARIVRWRESLAREDLAHGSRVAILVPNSIEHVCMDQAALSLGLVPVPLHVVDNAESLAFVIGDCGASLLLTDSADRWAPLAPLRERFPALRRVVYLRGSTQSSDGVLEQPLSRWLLEPGSVPGTDRPVPAGPDALAAIVYTSGTTGRPKGVMLTHRNVLSNVDSIMKAVPVQSEDVFLSFLPLSHTFERTVGYYLAIAAGATVAFARSVPLLMEDLRVIRPTILVSVPRIYERALAVIREKVQRRALTQYLFEQAVRLGWRRFEHRQGRGPRLSLPSSLLQAILDFLIAGRIRRQFGGRLRAAVTGGAALTREVAESLLALGLPLLQGYGMTESAPVIACNTPDDNDPSTVGRALANIEVRLGEQEELLTRSASVMLGYWNRAEETARVLESGWLHTGDQAEIVGGRIRIKGRIKDIIVTSTGEKIAPADLEAVIESDPLFDQVLVLGEQRPYLAALVVVNREKWAPYARGLGLDPQREADLHSIAATQSVAARIASLVKSFPIYATPRAVYLTAEPWTVAAGLITPTLKPKRAAIAARYTAEIAGLYRGH